MRLRKKKWIRDAVVSFEGSLIFSEKNIARQFLPLEKIFNNKNDFEMEIATGKGDFLVGKALRNPNINYIGVEKETEILYYAARKAVDAKLNNIIFLAADVANIEEYIDEKIISCMYVNFCDPWPKKKHAKKRLTYVEFLKKYKTILKKGASIIFKTDNVMLFDYSIEQFKQENMRIYSCTYNWHEEPDYIISNDVATEYEKKYAAQGKMICRACVSWTEESKI